MDQQPRRAVLSQPLGAMNSHRAKWTPAATSFGARNLFRFDAWWSRGAQALQSLCPVRGAMRTEVRAPLGSGSAAFDVQCSMLDVRCFDSGVADQGASAALTACSKTSCAPREGTRPTRFPRKSACIVGPVPSPGDFFNGLLDQPTPGWAASHAVL